MSIYPIELLAAILILIIAIIAGWHPFHKKIRNKNSYDFRSGQAFAAGVFLGAALIHMLGDSATQFSQAGVTYPMAFLLAGIVFLIMIYLEHLARDLKKNQHMAILATLMLSIHSLLAGAALGLSTNITIFVTLLLAILAHKWAAAFALAVELNQAEMETQKCIALFACFAVMTPLGILSGSIIQHSLTHAALLPPVVNALAAGTFLYLGTLHNFKLETCCNTRRFRFVIAGFALMAIVAIWT